MSLRPLNDLIQIVANGGSVDFEIGSITQLELVRLVANAMPQSTIIMRGARTRSTHDLIQISLNAVGQVVFVVE